MYVKFVSITAWLKKLKLVLFLVNQVPVFINIIFFLKIISAIEVFEKVQYKIYNIQLLSKIIYLIIISYLFNLKILYCFNFLFLFLIMYPK